MFVEILDEKEVAALDNLFNDTVYYLIKSGNEENVSLAKAKVSYLNNKRKNTHGFFVGRLVNTASK